MKISSVEKVMNAIKSIIASRNFAVAYGPEIVKVSGLSSTTVYSALKELTVTGMLEHNYHSAPYWPTGTRG